MKKVLFVMMLIWCGLAQAQTNIMLVSLPDKDTIDHRYPVFTWFYTQAPEGREEIRYNYVLVQLDPNQSALAGVTVNQPLLRINGISGFQLVYPFDAPELQYGKRYGWQLEKTINNVIFEKSEAWEFTLYREVLLPAKYALLNTDYSATIYDVTDDGFFFKLPSRYPVSGNPKTRITDAHGNEMQVVFGQDKKLSSEEEPEKTGRGFYYLQTGSYPSGTYSLIVTDPKGNVHNTRFRIK